MLALSFACVATYIVVATPEWATPNRSVDPALADSDGDGLLDELETAGWLTIGGDRFRTDPSSADTDGDGLTDLDEAGPVVELGIDGQPVYAGQSDPLVADTDGDDLDDAREADLDLDPRSPDTDGDGLEDGHEVEVLGTSAETADTDGDGFDDGQEVREAEDKGLDPLFADKKVSARSYATDFAIGAVAGDVWRRDSLAWFAGTLVSNGSSSIPVVGWVVGPLADVRDAVASAIRGDWVGAGFSAVGAVGYGGDAVSIPGKASKFAERAPQLATAAAAHVVAIPKIGDTIRYKSVAALHPRASDVVDAGASKKSVVRLAGGKTNLDQLASAMKRPGHVPGASARFFDDGPAGETWLENSIPSGGRQQVRAVADGCIDVCNKTNRRIIDVCVGGAASTCRGGVAHESKVGFKYLTPDLAKQIRTDAYLVKTGAISGAHWHFYASGVTDKQGAHAKVLDLLEEHDIPFTIHLPG